jgi:hypothetical protein
LCRHERLDGQSGGRQGIGESIWSSHERFEYS